MAFFIPKNEKKIFPFLIWVLTRLDVWLKPTQGEEQKQPLDKQIILQINLSGIY